MVGLVQLQVAAQIELDGDKWSMAAVIHWHKLSKTSQVYSIEVDFSYLQCSVNNLNYKTH